jgi:hypothetical protein
MGLPAMPRGLGDPTKRGAVYISRAKPPSHWARFPGDPEYFGHWEVYEPKPHIAGEGPGWDDAEEAIAWGRERAPRVIVILAASDQDYSAGEERIPSLPEWPPPDCRA